MNPVVHFELPYESAERISKFYIVIFGWNLTSLKTDSGVYILKTTTETDAKQGSSTGAINGGFFPKKLTCLNKNPSIVMGAYEKLINQ